jgi:hypothetical protein
LLPRPIQTRRRAESCTAAHSGSPMLVLLRHRMPGLMMMMMMKVVMVKVMVMMMATTRSRML